LVLRQDLIDFADIETRVSKQRLESFSQIAPEFHDLGMLRKACSIDVWTFPFANHDPELAPAVSVSMMPWRSAQRCLIDASR
jgi:hypothetical protein